MFSTPRHHFLFQVEIPDKIDYFPIPTQCRDLIRAKFRKHIRLLCMSDSFSISEQHILVKPNVISLFVTKLHVCRYERLIFPNEEFIYPKKVSEFVKTLIKFPGQLLPN